MNILQSDLILQIFKFDFLNILLQSGAFAYCTMQYIALCKTNQVDAVKWFSAGQAAAATLLAKSRIVKYKYNWQIQKL